MTPSPEMLTTSEVAALFRVDPRTVTRWADKGKIASIRTPGNQRRYPAAQVQNMIDRGTSPADTVP